MSKPVKKLFDLEIDEVSVVDRAANQHSLIAFSKSVEGDTPLEGSMPDLAVFEETGEAVDLDTLEHGDIVYDENGNELVFIEDGAEDDGDEGDEVGKANWSPTRLRRKAAVGIERAKRSARARGQQMAERGQYPTPFGIEGAARRGGGRALVWGANNPGKVALAGGGALAAGGGLGAYEATKKSLGDSVLEELSKAVTERDREEIIVKMADEVESARQEAAEAIAFAKAEQDVRIEQEFVAKAATYNLPVAAEVLGPILKSMAEVLDEDQLDIIDELFNAVGDALYNEIGYVGESSNSSVLDAVDAYANELVGKSDLTHEQAMVAMLEANPSAYDAYISEKGI